MKKHIISIVSVLVCIISPLASNKIGITTEAAFALSILIWAVIWWITKITPDYVTAMIMAVAMIILAKVPAKTVFSAFSNSSWWLLFTTFALSAGVMKSGLIKRMALYILRLFPASFKGQTLGLTAAGLITAPFIPNLSAKAVIMMPLTKEISQILGYEEGSKPDNGMFFVTLTSLRNAAPSFISASVLGYGIYALLPEDCQSYYSMVNWFLCSLPWLVSITTLNTICLIHRYGPKGEKSTSKEKINLAYRQLGTISSDEKKMLAILVTTLILWSTERIHQIPAYIISICALCVMLSLNIADRTDFRSMVNWDALIFIGITLGLSSCFSYLGIDVLIVDYCSKAVSAFSNHIYLFLLGIGMFTVLMRFIIVSELAYVNIFLAIFIPIAVSIEINPWVIGMTVYFFITPWFFLYQNPVYMASYYSVDRTMISEKEGAKYCLIYLVLCMFSLTITVAFWQVTGLLFNK